VAGADVGGVPVEQALAHEYGHNIAAYRLNTPWPAIDSGPKRLATYENVCANVYAGKMYLVEYNARRRADYREAHPRIERPCAVCGKPLEEPGALVCSERCRNRRKYLQAAERRS
jgi:hypothetical protein